MNRTEKAQFLLENYPEMLDFVDIIIYGRNKYNDENWLLPDGKGMSRKENYASKNRHSALYYSGVDKDQESGFDHLLHDMCRSAMPYVRKCRNIHHPKDTHSSAYSRLKVAREEVAASMEQLDDSRCLTKEEALNKYRGNQYSVPREDNK